jgi:DNA polymerase-3 subunit delta'
MPRSTAWERWLEEGSGITRRWRCVAATRDAWHEDGGTKRVPPGKINPLGTSGYTAGMDRILGQEAAIGTLRAALAAGRVHHAWIFHGPLGVGKYTAALEFAKLLLDPNPLADLAGNLSVDPASRTARLVDDGSHPDLHIIRKELALYSSVKQLATGKQTNIPIDLIRERIVGGTTRDGRFQSAPVALAPTLGHNKVFIIDEAHLLERSAQNALLKTLEEPSRGTYIILITARPHDLLPTIRSRCQRVAFRPLDDKSMRAWLDRSGLAVTGEEREWIESFADGSPGLATLAKQDGLHGWHVRLAAPLREVEQGRYAAALGELLAIFVDEYADAYVKRTPNASKDMANKAGAMRVFLVLSWHARSRLRTAGDRAASERALAQIDGVRAAEGAIESNVNLKMAFEDLAVRWVEAATQSAPALTGAA